MTYFVDHLKKLIHRRHFTGDACEFMSTPVDEREFTDSHTYIHQLKEHNAYSPCPNCRSFQRLTEQVKLQD